LSVRLRTGQHVLNAWQYQSLLIMQKVAAALGKDSDAAMYGRYVATMRASMNSLLYDPAAGAYYDGVGTTHQAQHSSLYAAALGVPDSSELPKIADWLASDTANPYGRAATLPGGCLRR
jgi:neutral trehalase